MIKLNDLDEAIAEIKGKKNQSSSDCIKLAAYLTIKTELFGGMPDTGYSYSGAVGTIEYSSDTEFSQKINGKSVDEIIPIIDEIMTALQRINPRLYNLAISKL